MSAIDELRGEALTLHHLTETLAGFITMHAPRLAEREYQEPHGPFSFEMDIGAELTLTEDGEEFGTLSDYIVMVEGNSYDGYTVENVGLKTYRDKRPIHWLDESKPVAGITAKAVRDYCNSKHGQEALYERQQELSE